VYAGGGSEIIDDGGDRALVPSAVGAGAGAVGGRISSFVTNMFDISSSSILSTGVKVLRYEILDVARVRLPPVDIVGARNGLRLPIDARFCTGEGDGESLALGGVVSV